MNNQNYQISDHPELFLGVSVEKQCETIQLENWGECEVGYAPMLVGYALRDSYEKDGVHYVDIVLL